MSVPHRWEINQVRLDQPLRPISTPENAAGVYLVFWWNDIPLGHALAHAGEFPLNEADIQRRALRAIAPAVGYYSLEHGFNPPLPVRWQNLPSNPPATLEPLIGLNRPLEQLATKVRPTTREVSISVIVCTRRRPEKLRRCLAALQQLNPSPTEIIVVDNAPDECCTRKAVEEFDGVIYWPEPASGLSRARNSGILRSSGEILAFTDDDVLVHPHWLLGVREALSQGTAFGMTGLVLPAELETNSQIQFEFDVGGFNHGYRPIIFDSVFVGCMLNWGIPVWRIGAGANMAFRREAFTRVGLFDERLGAGASGCSEDSEFWYRMLVAGMSIVYEPRAIVWHSHRIDREAFRSQMRQYIRGHVAALLVQFEKHRHFGNLRRLLATMPYDYCRRLTRVRFKSDWSLLFDELLGFASGFVSYFHQSLPKGFRSAQRTNVTGSATTQPSVSYRNKPRLPDFLHHNPFPHPYTQGLFYREKMRAIHRIAPDRPIEKVLEVGGGRSGLTSLLYPNAQIVNIDLNGEYASAPCNRRSSVRFICGDATDLPFENESFDGLTMFDLLEHVPDDHEAVREAFRVLRPGGFLLVSTPNEHWRFPYYRFMKAFCPPEEKLFAEWGHVRRGYSRAELDELVGFAASRTASFINPLTVLCHDIGFSNLSWRRRKLCWALLGPITLAGYMLHRAGGKGTETAYVWIKPRVGHRSGQRRSTPNQTVQQPVGREG
jgi:GT2 family glycosyltransferase